MSTDWSRYECAIRQLLRPLWRSDVGVMLMATTPSILPAILPVPPDPPKTTIARFRKFGEWSVCDICGLMMDYCRGHALPEFGTEPESTLKQRIAEAQKH